MEEDPTPGAVTWSGSIVIPSPRRLSPAASRRTIIGLTRLLVAPALIVLVIGVVVGVPPPVAGATRTWDGGSLVTQNWTDPLNWVGDVAPVAGDAVVFDATSVEPVTINASVTVQGVTIAAGYSGVITQAAGSTLTVTGGVADFIQAGGTFAGGNSAIAVSDQFTLSGGSFTSTTSTLTVNGAFTVSGGIFAHNLGTVRFSTSNATIDVPGSLSLNNVAFLSGTKTVAAGDTLDILGTLSLTGGAVATGTLAAQGDVTVAAGFTATGSSGTLLLNGAGNQTITASHAVGSGDMPNVVLNKPAGNLTLAGTLRTSHNWTYTAVPGTLTTTGHTMVFAGGTVTGSQTLNAVEIRGGTITIAAGTTVTASGTVSLVTGAVATGTLAAQGDVTVAAGFTATGSSGTLLLNGAGNQTITASHAVGSGDMPNVVLNKPAGNLTLAGTLRTSHNWTYTAVPGTLTTTGHTMVFAGGTVTGSQTLNAVEIRGGTITIAAGTTGHGQRHREPGHRRGGDRHPRRPGRRHRGRRLHRHRQLGHAPPERRRQPDDHRQPRGRQRGHAQRGPQQAGRQPDPGRHPAHVPQLDLHRSSRHAHHHRPHHGLRRGHGHRQPDPERRRDPGWHDHHRGGHHGHGQPAA